MKSNTFLFLLLVVITPFWLQSCAENTVNPALDHNIDTSENNYLAEIQPIFSGSCAFSGCHGGGSVTSGVKLNTYADVVSSIGNKLGKIVISGNVEDSPLVKVIEGTASGVARMPLGTTLNAEQINKIKNWIQNGAKNE